MQFALEKATSIADTNRAMKESCTAAATKLVCLRVIILFFVSASWHPVFAGSWIPTSAMIAGRSEHTSTLLANGRVLVAGGRGTNYAVLVSAEVYNPITKLWSQTAPMNRPRMTATATLLGDGKVLVTGGYTGSNYTSSVELYDPSNGTWKLTNGMNTTRYAHTTTLLSNGKVLVVGGRDCSSGVRSSAELFDPLTGVWTLTNSMLFPRYNHVATLLGNGKVLITGGYDGTNNVSTCELYDPVAGNWSTNGALQEARSGHTATLLLNGKVLVAGGYSYTNGSPIPGLRSSELFDPITQAWSPGGSMTGNRYIHTATLLPNGDVLVAGGSDQNGYTSRAEVYHPATDTWSITGELITVRGYHRGTMLTNGSVLVTGGFHFNDTFIKETELYVQALPFSIKPPVKLPNGNLAITFTNLAGLDFKMFATTNLSQSLTAWTNLGAVVEILPGQFQFTDTGNTNHPQRFYRVRAD